MRQKLIAGNWKMHGTLEFSKKYLDFLLPKVPPSLRVLIAPPYPLIAPMVARSQGFSIEMGAQNMHAENEGAFTGEVSALLLREIGAKFVILGHSERRHLFGETSAFIRKKVFQALVHGLQPIVCIGETLEEKESGKTKATLERQLFEALEGLTPEEVEKVVIAYEPVWAIGTGKSASVDLAEEMHGFCRLFLAEIFGKKVSDRLPILYGGSVKLENAHAFLKQENIDGALIGGASLDPEGFLHIIQSI